LGRLASVRPPARGSCCRLTPTGSGSGSRSLRGVDIHESDRPGSLTQPDEAPEKDGAVAAEQDDEGMTRGYLRDPPTESQRIGGQRRARCEPARQVSRRLLAWSGVASRAARQAGFRPPGRDYRTMEGCFRRARERSSQHDGGSATSEPVAVRVSPRQAAWQTGLSRTLIYREIERGHLRVCKVGDGSGSRSTRSSKHRHMSPRPALVRPGK
jgi:hypothetical protein